MESLLWLESACVYLSALYIVAGIGGIFWGVGGK